MVTDPGTAVRQRPHGCERWRFDVGVYVLGALSPPERHAFEEHLNQCHPCRDDLVSLAGMPGLLARLATRGVNNVDR